MKISSIRIKQLQQFKDLEIDLTYPKGHDRVGEPLDKVCIIGQSGTGKTTLLNLIKLAGRTNILDSWNELSEDIYVTKNSVCEVVCSHKNFSYLTYLDFKHPGNFYETEKVFKWTDFKIGDRKVDKINVDFDEIAPDLYKDFLRRKIDVLHFPTGFQFNNNEIEPGVARGFDDRANYQTLDFSYHNVKLLWREIENVLIGYRDELVSKLYEANTDKSEREKKLIEFDEWVKVNPNLLKAMGEEYLNRLLSRFRLKVNDEINLATLRDYEFIPLVHLDEGIEIIYRILSSAAQNIVYTSVPLYYYHPTDAIILIDEVENSFYPNVQMTIVGDYINIAPNNQYFFSTHSPIIASTFEPWEIVELKFSEIDGSIYREEAWKDRNVGRHVDNYKFDPKLLSWSSILTKIYDMPNDGQEERQTKISEFATLDEKIKQKRKNGEDVTKDVEHFVKLASSLDWKL